MKKMDKNDKKFIKRRFGAMLMTAIMLLVGFSTIFVETVSADMYDFDEDEILNSDEDETTGNWYTYDVFFEDTLQSETFTYQMIIAKGGNYRITIFADEEAYAGTGGGGGGGPVYLYVEIKEGSGPNQAVPSYWEVTSEGDYIFTATLVKTTYSLTIEIDEPGGYSDVTIEKRGIDPNDDDTDDDGLMDGNEVNSYGTSPIKYDSDDDGLNDGLEKGLGQNQQEGDDTAGTWQYDEDPLTVTDPLDWDSDSDDLNDGFEDQNKNGAINAMEIDPNDPDSDDDNFNDGPEWNYWQSRGFQWDENSDNEGDINMLDPDSDNDNLLDGDEVNGWDQILINGVETDISSDPTIINTDGDGLNDDDEFLYQTNPDASDTDGDGISDVDEVPYWDTEHAIWDGWPNYSPTTFESDTDNDGSKNTCDSDSDNDGMDDKNEKDNYLTDPGASDTDNDGLTDFEEDIDDEADYDIGTETDPLDDDTDDDGLLDGNEDENQNGIVDEDETNPIIFDTDNDGLGDGQELGLTGGQGTGTDSPPFVADSNPSTTTDPLDDDSDDDGLLDGWINGKIGEDKNNNGEIEPNGVDNTPDTEDDETDPNEWDTDDDYLSDGLERGLENSEASNTGEAFVADDDGGITTTYPNNPDSDEDGLKDGEEDKNHNGVVDETIHGPETDPTDDYSDGDGLKDGQEENGNVMWHEAEELVDYCGSNGFHYHGPDEDASCSAVAEADIDRDDYVVILGKQIGPYFPNLGYGKYKLYIRARAVDDTLGGFAKTFVSYCDKEMTGQIDIKTKNYYWRELKVFYDGVEDHIEQIPGVTFDCSIVIDADILLDRIMYIRFEDQDSNPLLPTPTDPLDDDTDDDELLDSDTSDTNPLDFTDPIVDFDNDALDSDFEFSIGTDPKNIDTDGDEMTDSWEYYGNIDPIDDSGDNGKYGDPDEDGITNRLEHFQTSYYGSGIDTCYLPYRMYPLKKDSDDDGLDDGVEQNLNNLPDDIVNNFKFGDSYHSWKKISFESSWDQTIYLKIPVGDYDTKEEAPKRITNAEIKFNFKPREQQITTNGSCQSAPRVSQNGIVWMDKKFAWAGYGYDIGYYDFSSGDQSTITKFKEGDQELPEIYDNIVVWQDRRSYEAFKYDIYKYDLTTNEESLVRRTGYHDFHPQIWENRIVFEYEPDINNNYVYYKEDDEVHQISGNHHTYPSIYGDKIVMRNEDDNNIYIYDLNKEEFIWNSNSGSAADPDIFGHRVVWMDTLYGKYDIFIMDLLSEEQWKISGNGNHYLPSIYGNRIVWQGHVNDNSDIYMYDIITAETFRITTDSKVQQYPDIYGNKIVWEDHRHVSGNDNTDIYMIDLTTDVQVDVGDDGISEWSRKGSYFKSGTNLDITDELNRYVWKAHNNEVDGYIFAPIKFSSISKDFLVYITSVSVDIEPLITNPTKSDTDEDGLFDGWRVYYYEDGQYHDGEIKEGTDSNNPDTDGDELWDGDEAYPGTIGEENDGLGRDGITNHQDYTTRPTNADSDSDGIYDFYEVGYRYSDIFISPRSNSAFWDFYDIGDDYYGIKIYEKLDPNNVNWVGYFIMADIYENLKPDLELYTGEIEKNVGIKTKIFHDSWTKEELRSELQTQYNNGMIGAVFVGHAPIARWQKVHTTFDSLPTDIYFQDLTGTWEDNWKKVSDNWEPGTDGIFDTHTGTTGPEIWVGQLRPPTTDNHETVQELRDYFDRVIRYINEDMYGDPSFDKALLYYDEGSLDDDDGDGIIDYIDKDENGLQKWLMLAYQENNIVICDGYPMVEDPTTPEDYIDRLENECYELVYLRAHSNPKEHAFYKKWPKDGDEGDVNSYADEYNIHEISQKSNFYILDCCSCGNYYEDGSTRNRYLAGEYVFGTSKESIGIVENVKEGHNEYGLGAFAATRETSGIDYEYIFYRKINNGFILGTTWLSYLKYAFELQDGDPFCEDYVLFGDPILIT